MLGDPDNDLSLWIVAWAGDDVVGSVIGRIYPTDNAASGIRRGWLDRVSVRRPWRRQGVASALIVARHCASFGTATWSSAALGVDSDNPTGALGVYERLGFRPRQPLGGLPEADLSGRTGGPVALGHRPGPSDERRTVPRHG